MLRERSNHHNAVLDLEDLVPQRKFERQVYGDILLRTRLFHGKEAHNASRMKI